MVLLGDSAFFFFFFLISIDIQFATAGCVPLSVYCKFLWVCYISLLLDLSDLQWIEKSLQFGITINIQVRNWNYFSVKASENANLIYSQQSIAPSESVTTSPFLSSSLLSRSFFNETFSCKGNDVSTLSQPPEKCQHLQQKNENKPPILSTSQAFSAIVLYSFNSSVS